MYLQSEDEEDSTGVKAALSMLRFYKSKLFFCPNFQISKDMFDWSIRY